MGSDDTTEDLVEKAKRGDREAFDDLVRRHEARLQRQIEARMSQTVHSRLEPADVLQETLARAFQSVGMFQWQGAESFYRWLASIAEHLIWNVSKRRVWRPLKLDPRDPRHVPPSKGLRREERLDRLEAALSDLDPDHRKVLMLARVHGMSLKEIAAEMKRSPGAIQKLLARAVLQLRQRFGDTESLHLPERGLGVDEANRNA